MAELVKIDDVKKGYINRHDGIINFFDTKNSYPQASEKLALHSATAARCLRLRQRFIYGMGLSEHHDFWKMIVNSSGLRVDQLLRLLVKDYSLHEGFALHVNYNLEGKINKLTPIPFARVRVGKPDDQDYSGKIVVYDKWGSNNSQALIKKDSTTYDVYNPDPDVVKRQIQIAGGLDKYKGQVLYFGETGTLDYPVMIFESVRHELETEAGVTLQRRNNVKTNFLASHIVEVPCDWKDLTTDPEDPEGVNAQKEFIDSLKGLSGNDGTAKFAVINNTIRDNEGNHVEIKLKKVDIQNFDKINEHTEKMAEHNIIKASGVPHILVYNTSTGFSTEIVDSYYQLYNQETKMERQIFEEIMMTLFSRWHKPVNVENYSIKPLSISIAQ